MPIYSMRVSVDGFIADREGGFRWTAPRGAVSLHLVRVRELGGYLIGRRLYESILAQRRRDRRRRPHRGGDRDQGIEQLGDRA